MLLSYRSTLTSCTITNYHINFNTANYHYKFFKHPLTISRFRKSKNTLNDEILSSKLTQLSTAATMQMIYKYYFANQK